MAGVRFGCRGEALAVKPLFAQCSSIGALAQTNKEERERGEALWQRSRVECGEKEGCSRPRERPARTVFQRAGLDRAAMQTAQWMRMGEGVGGVERVGWDGVSEGERERACLQRQLTLGNSTHMDPPAMPCLSREQISSSFVCKPRATKNIKTRLTEEHPKANHGRVSGVWWIYNRNLVVLRSFDGASYMQEVNHAVVARCCYLLALGPFGILNSSSVPAALLALNRLGTVSPARTSRPATL
ncbi:hypothetical protein BKA81DRAFT_380478 [Phyllosticta paracitricarpa]|uniref:Uncharacterized protein n=1 Tax=Phyllosticta citricarpa TaxID=55181 RepID=A0ABR1LZB9_9PEZI